jgi:uncharacterized pyridoxamine 5'-phosphate oxidase family protein
MKEVTDYLTKTGTQFFATLGLDGKPKVRPFHFMFEEDGKLWFCTSNTKEVFKELQAKPYVEFSSMAHQISWIRVSGKVVFSDSLQAKEKVFKVSPMVRNIYETPQNPAFEVFYLDEVNVSINEIGKVPQKYSL